MNNISNYSTASKIIIFDFEIFKHDTLLGAIEIDTFNNNIRLVQTWSLDEIREFYLQNTNSIWIGHNNGHYDNLILQSIVQGQSPYNTSFQIVKLGKKKYLTIKLYWYDLIDNHFVSLKAIECCVGKNISESEISFDIDRPLTIEEKLLTENYNFNDLDQTLDDLLYSKSELMTRLEVIKEFKLGMDVLNCTGTQLAEKVLHAKKIDNIENAVIKPILYKELQLENKEVINFYLSEKFRTNEKLSVCLCDVPHNIGSGGIHGAKKQCHYDFAFYFDVSGYYNLVMILYDLLPRSVPQDGKELYNMLYLRQLALKGVDSIKRSAYKTVLLSVFGAMMNEFCKFYDPYRGLLVTMTGQLFLVDLLEKLEGKIDLIQSNTDGIIAAPSEGTSEDELTSIIKTWENRTGFTLKLDKVYNIHQRDVNCYFFVKPNGKVHVKGEAVKYYNAWENPLEQDVFKSKEPPIIHHIIVDFFLYKKSPEQTVEENKRKLRMFQYVCKTQSFDWIEYQENFDDGTIQTTIMQNVNRAFSYKSLNSCGMLYKKRKQGKTLQTRISNLPDNVFVYNKEILSDETIDKLLQKIDFDSYIKRGYERISEFIKKPIIKDVNLC